jgi:hypothetical protein
MRKRYRSCCERDGVNLVKPLTFVARGSDAGGSVAAALEGERLQLFSLADSPGGSCSHVWLSFCGSRSAGRGCVGYEVGVAWIFVSRPVPVDFPNVSLGPF